MEVKLLAVLRKQFSKQKAIMKVVLEIADPSGKLYLVV